MSKKDGFTARLAFYRDPGGIQFHDGGENWRQWGELSPEAKLTYVALDAVREGVSAERFAEAAREILDGLTPREQARAALGVVLALHQEQHELDRLLPPDEELLGAPLVERFRSYIRDMHEALGVTLSPEPDPLDAARRRAQESTQRSPTRSKDAPEIG